MSCKLVQYQRLAADTLNAHSPDDDCFSYCLSMLWKTLWQVIFLYSEKLKSCFTTQKTDYNRIESSAFIFPFKLQCVQATSWNKLRACFIAYFTVCKYTTIIAGLIVVNLSSCCPIHTDTRHWSASKYFPKRENVTSLITNKLIFLGKVKADRTQAGIQMSISYWFTWQMRFNRRQERGQSWILNHIQPGCYVFFLWFCGGFFSIRSFSGGNK